MDTTATLSSLLVTVMFPLLPLISFLSTSTELCPVYQKPEVYIYTLSHGESQNVENKSYNVYFVLLTKWLYYSNLQPEKLMPWG